MPSENKASKVEKERRLTIVARMLLQGHAPKDIHRLINRNVPETKDSAGWKSWNLSLRQIRDYAAECRREWLEDSGERAEILAEYLTRLNDLYRVARSKEDVIECRRIIREQASLQGFYKFRIELGKIEIEIVEAPKPGEKGARI